MNAAVMVRGEGQARALPDRAVVNVAVEGEGGSRDDAYREAAALARAVDEVVARFGDAIDTAATAVLLVHPKTRWRKGENVRTGWHASRSTVLEVTAFGDLGELIAELSAAGASLAGPFWQLDPDNPAYNRARRLAAEDARRRADAYTSALGLEVGSVQWVAEPGLRREGPGEVHMEMAAAAGGASTRGAPEVIDVAPDEMPIRVTVEVSFSIEPAG